jgi:hypothetical protein
LPRQAPSEKKEEAAKFKSAETFPEAAKFGCSEVFSHALYGAESFAS